MVSSPAHPEPETGEGDAYLGHGEQAPGVGKEAERGLCARHGLPPPLPQPGMADRKQRDFRAREKPVDRDEQNDEQDAKWGCHVTSLDNNSIGQRLTEVAERVVYIR